MPWFTQHPEPSNVGEPQSVRDAWDKRLQAQADADAADQGGPHRDRDRLADSAGRGGPTVPTPPPRPFPATPMKGDRQVQKPNLRARARAIAGRAFRWTCGACGAVNPNITANCIRCGGG